MRPRSSLATAQLRRRLLLLVYSTLLFLLFGLTVLLVGLFVARSHYSLGDRAALLSDALTGGTLLLAFLAALIALQAYAAATGLPDLKIQLWFDYSHKNRPIFRVSALADGTLASELPTSQTVARISVANKSGYSARNPAVVIRLNGMDCSFTDSELGWSAIEGYGDGNERAIQWDGGANYSIHGNSVRRLPLLDLGQLHHISESASPSISIEVLAEGGYRREVLLPIALIRAGVPLSRQDIEGNQAYDWL